MATNANQARCSSCRRFVKAGAALCTACDRKALEALQTPKAHIPAPARRPVLPPTTGSWKTAPALVRPARCITLAHLITFAAILWLVVLACGH